MNELSTYPNFLIAGAPKCGTTSLYKCLESHPDISFCYPKEPHYFSQTSKVLPYCGPGDHLLNSSKYKSISYSQYQNMFTSSRTKLIGDASADYILFPESLRLIKSAVGDIPVIVILRNPVDRAYSAYRNMVERGWEDASFEKALRLEKDRILKNWDFMWHYKSCSFYADRVELLTQTFSKVKILVYEEFFPNFEEQIKETLLFLDLPDNGFIPHAVHTNKTGTSRYRFLSRIKSNEKIKHLSRKLLNQHLRASIKNKINTINTKQEQTIDATEILSPTVFENDIEKLEQILNRDFSIWKK